MDPFRHILRFTPSDYVRGRHEEVPLPKERGPRPRYVLSNPLPRTSVTNKNRTSRRYIRPSRQDKNLKLCNEKAFQQH